MLSTRLSAQWTWPRADKPCMRTARSPERGHRLLALGVGGVVRPGPVGVGAWQTSNFTSDARASVAKTARAGVDNVAAGGTRLTTVGEVWLGQDRSQRVRRAARGHGRRARRHRGQCELLRAVPLGGRSRRVRSRRRGRGADDHEQRDRPQRQRAASGSSQIAESLAVVSQSVGTTRAAAHESREAVAELDEAARRLTGLVDRFRSESPRR
jgi:hypothetical protein